ncbi:MAG: peptidoglycan DD-metalloendopeptidase family protein, partial [Pseudomonadota bacterium]
QLAAIETRAERAEAARARLYDQLEDAIAAGLGGLERTLTATGFDVDELVERLRRDYSGQGGPFVPAKDGVPAAAEAAGADAARVTSLMSGLERASLLRLATDKMPLAHPVRGASRFTSGFGMRRDPLNGRMRMHAGADFAGRRGTPIHATADGVVVFAGWQSGYGRVVKVRHAFGFETVYAHLNKARVKVGDRVALDDRIGDMGRTGRSTGVHLHYEIRVNGRPVNPMKYIEAARNVL